MEALKVRYSNKRRLASHFFGKILKFKLVRDSSLEELKRFLRTHQTYWNSLQSLQLRYPFDFVKLQLGLSHLDVNTCRLFEQKHPSQNIPTYKTLLSFVTDCSRREELMTAKGTSRSSPSRESRVKTPSEGYARRRPPQTPSVSHTLASVSCRETPAGTPRGNLGKRATAITQKKSAPLSVPKTPPAKSPTHANAGTPLKCWNCGGPHVFSRCTAPRTHVFCFRCGQRDVNVSSCPKCTPGNASGSSE
ncbi:hypothetical protein PUN28_019695 [Cardiocondyla obscurior]|uniref:Uncharacterized protein n=1 Tax=Cardiocondyla obscurior TaxID=286306 RepID=A0AAW2EAV7_9HYME